ncbi:AAA family ATPase [Streptomyces sp. NPDC059477]|uniref:AAA family ATPase n=1 Tax=Streptomyces sp. NPDC059477 TaxID=3346847 RepID=UPI0036B21062
MILTPPQLILLTGLQGSGKTTLARSLESVGYLRICPDEQVWQVHGHYGRDFPRGEYSVRERPILDQIAIELSTILSAGHSVVFDHGLWTIHDREEWRELGKAANAEVPLIYLPTSHHDRWERIRQRNRLTYEDPNAMYFTENDLQRHAHRFQPPSPDEPHIVYTGDIDPVLASLGRSAIPSTRWPTSDPTP